MKYNKQLFDQIAQEYNQLMSLAEFVSDQMLSQEENVNRFELLSNFDIYIQAVLSKIVLDDQPKNPALFNMIKKLSRYINFYQGINVDEWFTDKMKVLTKISDKVNNNINDVPTIIKLCVEVDNKSKTTEISYQILEGLISLVMSLKQDVSNFEEVETTILNGILKNVYDYINLDK